MRKTDRRLSADDGREESIAHGIERGSRVTLGNLKGVHTGGIHRKPVDSSLKACGLGGKNSEALGKFERKLVISRITIASLGPSE
jgi:hypothetical protein